MSDRKYRQPGYQDGGEKRPESRPKAKPSEMTFGPRTLNMPGAHTVSRCSQCGSILPVGIDTTSTCPKCGLELHSCRMCTHFDPSSRFECRQSIPERIFPKDKRNSCTYYSIKQSVERETTSSGNRVEDARKAFENLFKK